MTNEHYRVNVVEKVIVKTIDRSYRRSYIEPPIPEGSIAKISFLVKSDIDDGNESYHIGVSKEDFIDCAST